MANFKELRIQNISQGVLAHTFIDEEPILKLTSPSLKVVHNFTQKSPLRATENTTISQALKLVSGDKSDYVLVTNEQQNLLGLVSSADLQSAKITIIAQRLGVKNNEVSLSDVMTPITDLAGVSMQSLSYSCIGDALQTMEHQGVMFLLVTTAHNEICGLISAREIARKLQIPLHITPIAQTFSDVIANVEHPH
ncbi:CBS domain-containing protein [Pseudoalteromonas sp. MMG010]|uniref:CBS domain-containing protein n=1 Tax=Pseudoalteromonas sp. MMG010 TaxID=2822685 RepID=UPI001B3A1C52|nr:CBS domain-containing protein [Pseudoalteromonas sp. MMG010]MBQ4834339.1 CBS domain-containing protein [Pseudoalteromonas sp. MMG010]